MKVKSVSIGFTIWQWAMFPKPTVGHSQREVLDQTTTWYLVTDEVGRRRVS
jgi:hypothetical protein